MKVYFRTVGCRVNQIETESLREKFSALGHSEASSPEEAELIILNTCSVTARADRDCMVFLRKAAASNPGAAIAVTGCLATLDPERVRAAAPSASLFSNSDKEKIPAAFCSAPAPGDFFSVGGFRGRARAFVKVQEGCNLKCAYCLVNLARGELSSKPLKAAVEEVGRLARAGFAEIVLCGTRLGIYSCPETGADLGRLVQGLLALPGDFRLRFSSIESEELRPELLGTLRDAGSRFCDYFHVPLQAGSDTVLAAMGRLYDTARYRAKIEELRAFFPSAGIYADIIAGYPTETDEDFRQAEEFVSSLGLSGLHVFSFSARPGTQAAKLKPLAPSVVSSRSAALRALDRRLRASYAASLIGSRLRVLALKNKGGRAVALASNFVSVELPGPLRPGTLADCRITAARGGACSGEPL